MHPTHLSTQPQRPAHVVPVVGMIEATNYLVLASALHDLLAQPTPRVILDCRHLTYIGSMELKELLDLAHIARAQGGDIKCARLAPTLEQIVNLIANGDPLECYPAVTDAQAAFQAVRVAA